MSPYTPNVTDWFIVPTTKHGSGVTEFTAPKYMRSLDIPTYSGRIYDVPESIEEPFAGTENYVVHIGADTQEKLDTLAAKDDVYSLSAGDVTEGQIVTFLNTVVGGEDRTFGGWNDGFPV